MRRWLLICMTVGSLGLAGCAELYPCVSCHSRQGNSSSLVEFLYPNGQTPPQRDAIPQLRVPLRVGLTFLPSKGSAGFEGLDAARKEELLERIRQRFLSRKFVADIVVIPDYYLSGRRGFEGLAGVQRLYGVDLMALVSYDQVTHQDDNEWSLGYLTIVGAYVLKGSRHDVTTLVDLAVVDPATRSLVLRAGGTDTRHGNSTLINAARETRAANTDGFSAATDQVIDHFDIALTQFEADVRAGKANVHVTRRNSSGSSNGGSGGGGALDWPVILALSLLVVLRGLYGPWRRALAIPSTISKKGTQR